MVNAFQIAGGVLIAGGAGIFVYLGIEELKRRTRLRGTTLTQQTAYPQPQRIITASTISTETQENIQKIDQIVVRTLDWWNYLFGGTEVIQYIQKIDLRNTSAFRLQLAIPLSNQLKLSLQSQVPQQVIDYIERIRPYIVGHLSLLLSLKDSLRQGIKVDFKPIEERNIAFGKQMAEIQRRLTPVIKNVNFMNLQRQGVWNRLENVKQYLTDPKVTVDRVLMQKT